MVRLALLMVLMVRLAPLLALAAPLELEQLALVLVLGPRALWPALRPQRLERLLALTALT